MSDLLTSTPEHLTKELAKERLLSNSLTHEACRILKKRVGRINFEGDLDCGILQLLCTALRIAFEEETALAGIAKVSSQQLRELSSSHARDISEWLPLFGLVQVAIRTSYAEDWLNLLQWDGWERNSLPQSMRRTSIQDAISSEHQKADHQAWMAPFIGNAHEVLWHHIVAYSSESLDKFYAYYVSVIQSSGMGKSRIVARISEDHLVVPISLKRDTNGYPPTDVELCDFLVQYPDAPIESLIRFQAFLISLFIQLKKVLEGARAAGIHGEKTVAEWFKQWMEDGSTYESYGENRRTFYAKVICRAKKLMKSLGAENKFILDAKSEKSLPDIIVTCDLRDLDPNAIDNSQPLDLPSISKRFVQCLDEFFIQSGPRKHKGPHILLSFDNAQALINQDVQDDPRSWSLFSALRRILRFMGGNGEIFSLFLMTAGHVDATPSPVTYSKGVRWESLSTFQPLHLLGFDQHARDLVRNGAFLLDDAVKDEWIVKFGRPLWNSLYVHGTDIVRRDIFIYTAGKLANSNVYEKMDFQKRTIKLATVGLRLGLEIVARTETEMKVERQLVRDHMRVVSKVWSGFEAMRTRAASEPTLAEGAILLMGLPQFDPIGALSNVLDDMLISSDRRAVQIAAYLLLLSRDVACRATQSRRIPIMTFLKNLFCEDISKFIPTRNKEDEIDNTPLHRAFSNASVHFTHVLLRDDDEFRQANVWLLIARGALIVSKNGSEGVDILVPVVFGNKVCAATTSAILIKVEDEKVSQAKFETMFDRMDPGGVDLNPSIPDLKATSLPVLRVLMAFKNKEGNGILQPPVKTYQHFVSYDIICCGTRPYKVIEEDARAKWQACLDLATPYGSLYQRGDGTWMGEDEKELLRLQMPNI